jgi:hypothetical protein
VIIGVWNKAGVMSNGKTQSQGMCNELVEDMAKYLGTSGY